MNKRDAENADAIEDEAAALPTRRDAGWSPEGAAEFAPWRAAESRREAAVRRIEATQRLLARLPESPPVRSRSALSAPRSTRSAIAPPSRSS